MGHGARMSPNQRGGLQFIEGRRVRRADFPVSWR